jgi:hypothetical protein
MARVIPGRGVRRVVFALAAVVSAAIGLVLLTLWLWQEPQGANQANVLALPVGVISLLVAAGFGWKASRRQPTQPEVAGRLMKQVLADRQRFIDQALGVHWKTVAAKVTFTNPNAGSLPAAMAQLLVNWQDLDGGRAGSIEDVSAFYRGETDGRLVVLGAPGSGKSVLLSHLVRDLVNGLLSMPEADWPASWRLPIMLSLSGCDLGDTDGASQQSRAERLSMWIVRRLVEDYQVPDDQANTLVSDQRILPVLDGLDEMDPAPPDDDSGRDPPPRAAAVIQALNAERTPVVLACRDVEYQGLTVDTGGSEAPRKPTLLTDARHVVLQPLPAPDIIGYLTDRFSSRTQLLPNRWQPVADALNAGKPLLGVLENPWQLFLAVKAYGEETSDPAELVNMTPEQANEELLAALIPAVTDDDNTNAAWTAEDVRRWLSSIADHKARSSRPWRDSLTDIRLPELWNVAEQSRRFDPGLDSAFREFIREVRESIWEFSAPIIAATPTLLVALLFFAMGWGDLSLQDLFHLRDMTWQDFLDAIDPKSRGFLFVGVLLGVLGLYFGSAESTSKSQMVRFDLDIFHTSSGRRTYLRWVASRGLSGVVDGLMFALFFVLGSWLWSVLRPPARLSRLESALSPGLGSWLMNWLESVLLPRLESVLLPALAFGLAAAVIQGLIEAMGGWLEIAPSPSVLARQCIQFHTAYGLASGLVFGVGIGLWCGQRLGLAPGLAIGVVTGLALGLGFGLTLGGSAWLRYAVGVRVAVRQHLLPKRPTLFLDWCLRVGLMRMAGSSLQFRHRQLQDWLTSAAARAEQAEWQALSRRRADRHSPTSSH